MRMLESKNWAYYFHPHLEFWVYPIDNSDNAGRFGGFLSIFHIRKIVRLGINGTLVSLRYFSSCVRELPGSDCSGGCFSTCSLHLDNLVADYIIVDCFWLHLSQGAYLGVVSWFNPPPNPSQ